MATARVPPCSPECYFTRQPKGKPLTSSQKQTVLNVYSALRRKTPGMLVEDVVEKTAELTGVAKNAIFKMKKEFNGCNVSKCEE